MNRNSNVYTIVYATVLTVVVAILLAVASLGLKDKQKKNTDNEKKMMILSAILPELEEAGIAAPTLANAGDIWSQLDMDGGMTAVDVEGKTVATGAEVFEIVPKQQFTRGEVKADATLPVFKATVAGRDYYILALYGAGLWDAIWGYLAVESDGSTVAGANFDHAGETAGLGAKIKDDPAFAASFVGKHLFASDGDFTSVAVLKAGKKADKGDQVDAITGATMTSNGVSDMIRNSIKGYVPFLQSLRQPVEEEDSISNPEN